MSNINITVYNSKATQEAAERAELAVGKIVGGHEVAYDNMEYVIATSSDDTFKRISKNSLKIGLTIENGRLQAVAPGVLPAGPTGETRYMEVTAVGTWTYGGVEVGSNADGFKTTFWWTGSAWVNNGSVRVKGEDGASGANGKTAELFNPTKSGGYSVGDSVYFPTTGNKKTYLVISAAAMGESPITHPVKFESIGADDEKWSVESDEDVINYYLQTSKTNGRYITSEGTTTVSDASTPSVWQYSDPIPVSAGDNINAILRGDYGLPAILFYTSTDLSSYSSILATHGVGTSAPVAERNFSVTIPSNGYIRFNNRFSGASGGISIFKNRPDTVYTDAQELLNKIKSVESENSNKWRVLPYTPNEFETIIFNSKYYINNNGTSTASDGAQQEVYWQYSEPIPVLENEQYMITVAGDYGLPLALFYSDTDLISYVSTLATFGTAIELKTVTVTIPENGFLRINNRIIGQDNDNFVFKRIPSEVLDIDAQYLLDLIKQGGEVVSQAPSMATSISGDEGTWNEMQAGLFIHWGVYSVLAGNYNGLNLEGNIVDYHTPGNGAEWIMNYAKIPKDLYMDFSGGFNTNGYNPELWCKLAKSIGLKYVVLTVRHHDGFSLVPSENAYWDITSTPADVNAVKRLKDACDKYNLKFGFYISQFTNWTERGGYNQAWQFGSEPTEAEKLTYTQNTIAYIDDLVANYNPFVLWWDMGMPGQPLPAHRDLLENHIKTNYPNILTNNRIAKANDDNNLDGGDFVVNEYGEVDQFKRRLAESCYQINSWGYNSNTDSPSHYPTVKNMCLTLVRTLFMQQNFLLNIPPKGDGSLPELIVEFFGKLSNFTKKIGGLGGFKRMRYYAWSPCGYLARRGNSVYLVISDRTKPLTIDGIDTFNLLGVHVFGLSNPTSETNYTLSDDRITINKLPSSIDEPEVVRIDFSSDVVFDDYNHLLNGEAILPTTLARDREFNNSLYRFRWMSATSNKRIKHTAGGSRRITVEDIFGNLIFDATIANETLGSTFELKYGEIYKVTVYGVITGGITIS